MDRIVRLELMVERIRIRDDLRTQQVRQPAAGSRAAPARDIWGRSGSSGRIRTYDPPVNSRMLYR
jgi:hypothetical protein